MSKKKDTVNNPIRVAELELSRAAQMQQDGKSFIEVDKDGNEKEIIDHKASHHLEFRGSNNFYLCDAAKYFCTHHKESLRIGKIYIEAESSYEKFLSVTIGEFANQRQRLMDELGNTGKRKCYIPNGKGSVFIMIPFNVVYETVETETMTDSEFKRLYYNIYATQMVFK
jgi:hypothetical protein